MTSSYGLCNGSGATVARLKGFLSSTVWWYIVVALIGTLSFVILNRMTDGFFFDQAFYLLHWDAHTDFYVFLVGDSLDKYSYLRGNPINPPLVKVLMDWVSGSFPQEVFDTYRGISLAEAVTNGADIRGDVYCSLPFVLCCAVSLSVLSTCYFHCAPGGPIQKGVLTLLALCSVGVLFALERGNLVMLAGPILLLFIVSLESESRAVQEVGLLCYAFATALKVYPIVFGILLLIKRKPFCVIARAALYVIVLLIGPFFIYGGFAALANFIRALLGNSGGPLGVRPGGFYLASIATTVFRMFGGVQLSDAAVSIWRVLGYLTAIILAALSSLLDKYWKQVLAVSLAMLLLPGYSLTYNALYLLAPLLLFLVEEKSIDTKTALYLTGFIALTVLFPLSNSGLAESLRNEMDSPNRVTALMLLNEAGEVLLLVLVITAELKAVVRRLSGLFKTRGRGLT